MLSREDPHTRNFFKKFSMLIKEETSLLQYTPGLHLDLLLFLLCVIY